MTDYKSVLQSLRNGMLDKVYIVTPNYRVANFIMKIKFGINPKQWEYVHSPHQLHGLHNQVVFYYWFDNYGQKWYDIQDYLEYTDLCVVRLSEQDYLEYRG